MALKVFTLAGERVADIPVDSGTSGRFSATWDGRDEQGIMLSPGLYLLMLKVNTDDEAAVKVSSLPLVY